MYAKILVPTDGSKLSDRAVAEAAQLAALCGAKLLLLHVQQPLDDPRTYQGQGVGKHFRDARREAGEAVIATGTKAAARNRIEPASRIVEDFSPFNAIMKAVKNDKCDLIVMASHGRRGLRALLIGSETQKVLTHSLVPVLVVR
jgi:nucleotide-binding universal stress UspA family protein